MSTAPCRKALKTLGYEQLQIDNIVNYIEKHDTIEGAPELNEDDLPVFDCAFKPAGDPVDQLARRTSA